MASKNSSSLPETPSYQQDPMFREALKNLSTNAQQMATLSLGNNPKLAETIQFHPEMLDTFMNTLKTQLTPQVRDLTTQTTNELANLGALESSTTANSLGRINENFLNTLQVQTGQYGLEQMMKAMENRINIANMGMQGLSSASQIGGQAESNLNNFNLANYENQVAKYLYDKQNKSGGFLGALQGGMGGAMSGFALTGNPMGALLGGIGGATVGGFSPSAVGTGILNMGMASAPTAFKGISGAPTTNSVAGSAGSTASNNLFRSGDNLYVPKTYDDVKNNFLNSLQLSF